MKNKEKLSIKRKKKNFRISYNNEIFIFGKRTSSLHYLEDRKL